MMDSLALNDKVAVITGATSGIGLATAKLFCEQGANVIGIGRSFDRCHEAQQSIQNLIPDAKIQFIIADLNGLENVRRLAGDIIQTMQHDHLESLDILVNNAGTFSAWYTQNADGIELQMAVNHIAPFLLTNLLLPVIQKSQDGRIITISSGSHYRTKLKWDDLQLHNRYNCLLAYKQTKLCNVLFTLTLNQRLTGTTVKAFAADPGLVNTSIGEKGTSPLVNWFWRIRKRGGTSPDVPAKNNFHLASSPDVIRDSHFYYKNCSPLQPSTYALREDMADKLWKISAKICSLTDC